MTNILLDYSLSLGEKTTIWERPFSWLPEAEKLYKRHRETDKCPYCETLTKEVMYVHRWIGVEDDWTVEDRHIVEKVYGCDHCGWWIFNRTDIEYNYREDEKRRVAVLREFDVHDKELPLLTLKKELNKKPNILYDIHDKKFEELVASVLGDFYDVEVQIIGKRGDGGIDLVYVDSDKPFAIQVKRRLHPDKTETISLVREFLGALILKGYKHGKIVTTASHFSTGAHEAGYEILQNDILQSFELINFNQFMDMFRFARKKDIKYPWEEFFSDSLVDWLNLHDAEVRYTGFRNIEKTLIKPKKALPYYKYSRKKQNDS